jgi:serine/threonine protein kinase
MNNNVPNIEKFLNYLDKETADKIRNQSTKKKRKHHHHKRSKSKEKDAKKNKIKKSVFNDEMFILNGNYNIIKLLGYGTFGEIMLAFDNTARRLRAIKFELFAAKNAQLKHEFTVYEQLNTIEEKSPQKKGSNEKFKSNQFKSETISKIMNNYVDSLTNKIIGIPQVYLFDIIEGKFSYMVMDFLGPSINDLFQLMQKKLSLQTVCMCAMQMICRLEYVHEKGYIHRDIKPENFVTGVDEDSNTIYIIDFGLSLRYKDKKTGAHIPYREKRQMVGTVRYASINTQIGIEQSRRDDVEALGYVLVYLALGRLPWMRVGKEKGKGHLAKVLEKKLITPPEILCKKLPRQFAFLFQYLRKLKFEERPDYNMIKCLFGELFLSKFDIAKNGIFSYDWFKEDNNEKIEDDNFTLKKEKEEKSSVNEINEKEENNEDKANDSSKVLEENDEYEHDNKENEHNQENLNEEDEEKEEKEEEEDKDNGNLINDSNKEEHKKEKSSSGSYGLIKSDSNNKK